VSVVIECNAKLVDGRCPDGCCGSFELYVQSPKTGKHILVLVEDVPKPLRGRLPRFPAITTLRFTAGELRDLYDRRTGEPHEAT
jgi:hypothetical protein